MPVSCKANPLESPVKTVRKTMSGKTLDMVEYVLTYATYALEDAQTDFKEDVMENQGWTQAEADAGYAMLGKIIASLQCYITLVTDRPSSGE
jgi:hypothetical protein